MGDEVTIEVPDSETAREIAYGIIGRAGDIYKYPDSDNEEMALELRDIGHRILEEYREE